MLRQAALFNVSADDRYLTDMNRNLRITPLRAPSPQQVDAEYRTRTAEVIGGRFTPSCHFCHDTGYRTQRPVADLPSGRFNRLQTVACGCGAGCKHSADESYDGVWCGICNPVLGGDSNAQE